MTVIKKILFFVFLVLFISCINLSAAECSDKIETAGDVGAVAVPAAALGLAYFHNDKEGMLQFLEAFAASTAVTYGLKYTVKETRPNGRGQHSFPSFHAAAAFSGAAFVQQRDGWKYGLPLYLVSSFVAYSRVESREHHIRDVVAGAAIGIGANLIFTKPYEGVTVAPLTGKGFAGILIGKSF